VIPIAEAAMTGFSWNATEYSKRALPSNESRNSTAPSGLASTTLSAAGSWAANESKTSNAIRIGISFPIVAPAVYAAGGVCAGPPEHTGGKTRIGRDAAGATKCYKRDCHLE
jgi:hypothetical protein